MESKLFLDDRPAFDRSLAILAGFKSESPRLLALNFAVEIAILIHRDRPGLDEPSGPPGLVASPGSGPPISTRDLQRLVCDETYAKREDFLPDGADGPIHKLFSNNFKARRRNNWRNSIDLQRGLACDAPFSRDFLQSERYLEEPRFDCPFRDAEDGSCGSPAGLVDGERTCFNPAKRKGQAPGADSRALPAPKLLTRTSTPFVGYWYVEPTVASLVELVGSTEKRVPLFPFMVALYGGSPYFEPWGREISRSRFEADIRLSLHHLAALFELDPDAPLNAAALDETDARGARTGLVPAAVSDSAALSPPVPYRFRDAGAITDRLGRQGDPADRLRLLERSRRGHQRALKALADHLAKKGDFLLEEQLDGFDLLAMDDDTCLMFEVKTWSTANLARQVRHGWAQLREYRYRNRESLPSTVSMYLVLDREPPRGAWQWDFLADDCEVVPTWIKRGQLDTLPRFRDRLP